MRTPLGCRFRDPGTFSVSPKPSEAISSNFCLSAAYPAKHRPLLEIFDLLIVSSISEDFLTLN